MKFIGKLLAGIAIFLWTSGFSQVNLVPNPSFEEYTYLPEAPGDAKGSMAKWMVPVDRAGGDYYHSRSTNKDCQTEQNYFGGEKPHSGNAYAGFCVTPQYREFLATKLITPLEKGKQYRFKMYISRGDKMFLSDLKEIGVLFMTRQTAIPFGVKMHFPPQIVFYQDSGFTQRDGWQELTAIYTANGTESWMIIGPHEWKCDTCTVPGKKRTENPSPAGIKHEAHYYIDDVSLEEIGVVAKPNCKDLQPSTDTAKEIKYVFYDIRFKSNSAILEPGDQKDLDFVVQYMMEHPATSVTVSGHTDSIGAKESNHNLSHARADAVKKYLMDHGIQSSRITTVGEGEEKPVAPNSTEAGRALNRRVEFLFTQK